MISHSKKPPILRTRQMSTHEPSNQLPTCKPTFLHTKEECHTTPSLSIHSKPPPSSLPTPHNALTIHSPPNKPPTYTTHSPPPNPYIPASLRMCTYLTVFLVLF